jgi:hypothetical protein
MLLHGDGQPPQLNIGRSEVQLEHVGIGIRAVDVLACPSGHGGGFSQVRPGILRVA